MPTRAMQILLMCEALYEQFLHDFHLHMFERGSKLEMAQRGMFAKLAHSQMTRILHERYGVPDDLGFTVIVIE